MQISLPNNFNNLDAIRKNDFMKCWVIMNRDNLSIKLDTNTKKAEAYDRETCEKITEFEYDDSDIEHLTLLQDDVETREFVIKFIAKPCDVAYAIIPEFIPVEEDGTLMMDFRGEDKIKKVVITKISGTSDIYDNNNTVGYEVLYDEDEDGVERETGTIVQEAVFATYEAAKAVSELIDNPLDSWATYKGYAESFIKYRYMVKLPVKYGEIAYMTGDKKVKLEQELTEKDKKGFLEKVRFSRAILSNLDETVDVQVTGSLYSMEDKKFVTLKKDDEVLVDIDYKYGYKFPVLVTSVGCTEVHRLCGSYRLNKGEYSIEPIEE